MGSGFLFDGNGGRQSFNGIHIGLAHQRQKLSGISRKALHIATLAFGVEGIKSQGGFA